MRVFIERDPFIEHNKTAPWRQRGHWPCAWVCHPQPGDPPFVTAYRLRFTLDRDAVIRAHVSADERYELFFDGERIGRGPERGDPMHWFYESYDLSIPAGDHVLAARVWALGPQRSPVAQMTVHPGFIFAPEGDFIPLCGTGVAAWEVKRLGGYDFMHPNPAWGTGWNPIITGSAFDWDFERGAGDGWEPVQVVRPGAGRMGGLEFPGEHRLQPATLPPMLAIPRQIGTVRLVADAPSADAWGYQAVPIHLSDHKPEEADAWADLVQGRGAVTVPPHTVRRVIIDLDDYYCAYPEIVTSGGAGSVIRVLWEESMRPLPDPWNLDQGKGNRNEIEGKYFVGTGDTFLPDGGMGRRFETLWWKAGRYVMLLIQTADAPLTVERFTLTETRYPLENEGRFQASDPRLEHIIPILVRGLQMCAHETYMDCPYYEQLMYVGDTRLEILATYALTCDDRLPRKALRLFDVSRNYSGMTQERYPNREFQVCPPFSLWWVAMLHDYAYWRDDLDFVRARMPGARAILDGFAPYTNAAGLIEAPEGWNFMDWVPEWESGNPPDGVSGVSGVINWLFIVALTRAADLETLIGEDLLAARNRQRAAEWAARMEAFWDDHRGLYADDLAKQRFSEHAQCLAILSGLLDDTRRARVAKGLLADPDLSRTTIYFTHYLFEAYRALGRIDRLFDRLQLWYGQVAYGAKTPIEKPEPSRSDCHAWGSHPLYHYFASILGIRPASAGFRTVEIAPQPGLLTHASGVLPHPRGAITVELHAQGSTLSGSVTLPDGITGVLRVGARTLDLHAGRQEFRL